MILKREKFFIDATTVYAANTRTKADGTVWLVVLFNNGIYEWFDINNNVDTGVKLVRELYQLKMEGKKV